LADDLDELVRGAGGLAKFFSFPFQKTLAAEHKIVYVVDEAQLLFPRSFRQLDVFTFFQKHRHLGMDVYLMTQDVATLALELRNLAEYYVRAVRRSYSVLGEFRYKFVGSPSDKAGFKNKVLKREPRIFALYRSMTADESEKIKSAPLKYLAMMLALALVCFGIIGWVVMGWYGKGYQAVAAPKPSPFVAEAPPVEHPAVVKPQVVEASWERDGEVYVAGLLGNGESGSLFGTRVGEKQERRWSYFAFARLCRCHPDTLRAGDLVPVWRMGGGGAAAAPSGAGGDAGSKSPRRLLSPRTSGSTAPPLRDSGELVREADALGRRTEALVDRAEKMVDSEKGSGIR
jgi:Zonular occludens toxin (Zot)